MTLFEMDLGGVAYWVAATSKEEAHKLLAQSMVDEGWGEREREEALMEMSCRALTASENPDLVLRGDGDPDRSMWEAFDEITEPQVVACSEWP